MSIDSIELARRFSYHPPHGNQAERYQAIREAGLQFAYTILALTPSSAEQTLAIRALEESVMRANQAIAIREDQAPASSPAFVSQPENWAAPFTEKWANSHEAGLMWALQILRKNKKIISGENLATILGGQASAETCQAWLEARGYVPRRSGQGEDQAEGEK